MVDVVVLLPPEAPKQNVDEPPTPVEGRVACDADPDMVGNEPRPVVPRPLGAEAGGAEAGDADTRHIQRAYRTR